VRRNAEVAYFRKVHETPEIELKAAIIDRGLTAQPPECRRRDKTTALSAVPFAALLHRDKTTAVAAVPFAALVMTREARQEFPAPPSAYQITYR
jgi:hypothetical protein